MIYQLSLFGFDFHISVDFGLIFLFPHIFSVLHRISVVCVDTDLFLHVMHGSALPEEISMKSSLDTRLGDFGGKYPCCKNCVETSSNMIHRPQKEQPRQYRHDLMNTKHGIS